MTSGWSGVACKTDPQLLASVWSEEELPMLMATAAAWGLTPEELQKFGAVLLAFFVGFTYG